MPIKGIRENSSKSFGCYTYYSLGVFGKNFASDGYILGEGGLLSRVQ
jgi:hypothetical protein